MDEIHCAGALDKERPPHLGPCRPRHVQRARRAEHPRGTKAIVTVESSAGKRFSGAVQSLQTENQETTATIFLKETPQSAQPQTPCHVTVDTSVASEALKPD